MYKYGFWVKPMKQGQYAYMCIESNSKQWAMTTGRYMSMEFGWKQWNSK